MADSTVEQRGGRFLDLAAAASAGAALVHAAAAGAHSEHNSVQLLFVACAVLQLAWAAAVYVAVAPLRILVVAGLVLNAGAVAAWLTQRTVGLPVVDALREPEEIGLQDSLAALLGLLAALGAAAWLLPAVQRLPMLGRRGVAIGGAFALLLAAPAMASDHGGAGHTHEHGAEASAAGHDHSDGHSHSHEAAAVEVADIDRCDLGFNTAQFNDDTTLVEEMPAHSHDGVGFTVADWAEEFADRSLGIDPAALTQWLEADEYRTRDVLAGDLTPALAPDSWVPMSDPAQCSALAGELQQVRDVAANYPTLADALADGYVPGSLYAPGQGAHFSKMENIVDDGFHPDKPELLMFDSQEPDAKLMGVMYYLVGDPAGLPPEHGFTGSSDVWHSHKSLCRDAVTGVAVSWRECDEGRANVTDESYGYMLHAWVVPGCESDWGVFSPANPRLPYLPTEGSPFPDITLASGCNSGKTVADPLTFDDSGAGAVIR